jgi:hypothetical protein
MFASSSSAQNSAAPDNIKIDFTENYKVGTSHWESSGAFTDAGAFLDIAKHDLQGASVNAIGTLAGSNGTFTMKWRRVNTITPGEQGNPEGLTKGAWQMVSGTGAYAEITGQGTFAGTINHATGEIVETFIGNVRLGQTNDALRFRVVK